VASGKGVEELNALSGGWSVWFEVINIFFFVCPFLATNKIQDFSPYHHHHTTPHLTSPLVTHTHTTLVCYLHQLSELTTLLLLN
jgi:hypothetical protein